MVSEVAERNQLLKFNPSVLDYGRLLQEAQFLAAKMMRSQIKLLVSWPPVQIRGEQDLGSASKRLFTMDPIPDTILESEKAFTMDWRSHPIPPPNPRPTSSVYSDDMSIMTGLVRKVSEETRVQEYHTIACYMRENQALEDEIALHRMAWTGTIMLADEVIQAITIIEEGLITVDASVASAEKDWLAFWGIYKESLGPHPPWL